MTTATFNALMSPTIHAIAAVRNEHCKPPTYAPPEPVSGRMKCPRCNSALNFTVTSDGRTSGRCVAAACIKWSLQ